MNLLIHTLAEFRLTIIVIYDIQTFVDRLFIFEWKYYPATQQTASHRAHRAVYHVEQRLSVLLHRLNQFQRADSKLIQTHILILLDTRDRRDMSYLRVLCLLQVLQDSTSSYHTTLQMIYAKAFQVLHTEMLQQLLTSRLIRKHPVV